LQQESWLMHRVFRIPTFRRRRKFDTRAVGLELGLVLGKHFLGLEDLHYGYWTADMPLDMQGLKLAQQQYSSFLTSYVPRDARRILDVGCGGGALAKRLMDDGFQVDCVSPSPLLTQRARQTLGRTARIFECRFEELETERLYDVVLFSESFQYMPPHAALQKSVRLLADDGTLLICDYFRTAAKGKSPIGGGHRLELFYEAVANLPLRLEEDVDITEQTAPTIDLANEALMRAGLPLFDAALDTFRRYYPWTSKLVMWALRKRLDKIRAVHFSGQMSAEVFKRFKTYRLMSYRKASVACPRKLGREAVTMAG
jgi:SAM-dependent methyltransferase